MTENAKAKPVSTVSQGLIQAAIWRNDTDKGVFYNVTFERRYRQGNDWKSTHSFGRDDLLTLAKVADLAHTAIGELQSQDRAGKKQEDSGDQTESEDERAAQGRAANTARQRAR